MYCVYKRTKEVYDIEEETGKSIEDFLDEDCFISEDGDEEEYDEEDNEDEDYD